MDYSAFLFFMLNYNYKFDSSLKSYHTAYVGKLHVSTFFISWVLWLSFCCCQS